MTFISSATCHLRRWLACFSVITVIGLLLAGQEISLSQEEKVSSVVAVQPTWSTSRRTLASIDDPMFGPVRNGLPFRRLQDTSRRCPLTLSIYDGFDELMRSAEKERNNRCKFGMICREFEADLYILQSFMNHPCRVPHEEAPRDPRFLHVYVIPVPWATLARSAQSRPLVQRAQALVKQHVISQKTFKYLKHRHVLLHTSTAYPVHLWGALAKELSDPRIITLHLEGYGGDGRSDAFVPGPRTIAVPYFVEPLNETRSAWERESKGSREPGAFVYLRCSPKNSVARQAVLTAFEGVRDADVGILKKGLEYGSQKDHQSAFLTTASEMSKATFCLVPPGYTATSRRLYEAFEYGCVPVLLSERFSLPFQASPDLNWNASMIQHPIENVNDLPARLAKITPQQIDRYREFGAKAKEALSYSHGAATAHIWKEVAQLVAVSSPSGILQIPEKLFTETREHGALVVTVCASSAKYATGAKRKTSIVEFRRWAATLRGTFSGPVAVIANGEVETSLEQVCNEFNIFRILSGDESLWRPPAASNSAIAATGRFVGNQMRLLWFVDLMHQLDVLAADADVLIVDARDVVFQRNPVLAASKMDPTGLCLMAAVDDCSCKASADSYFQTWGRRCLLDQPFPYGAEPPVNGGMQFGKPGALHQIYGLAAITATLATDEECRHGGRDQHLITSAVRTLHSFYKGRVCVRANDFKQQTAIVNLGVNNDIKGKYILNHSSGFVETTSREPFAIVHQFDRRMDISKFLEASHTFVGERVAGAV